MEIIESLQGASVLTRRIETRRELTSSDYKHTALGAMLTCGGSLSQRTRWNTGGDSSGRLARDLTPGNDTRLVDFRTSV